MQELRPEVAWFALQMEMALRRNDHKGGWEGDDIGSLYKRLSQESRELHDEIHVLKRWTIDNEAIVREAADVANFAMMIADNAQNRGG